MSLNISPDLLKKIQANGEQAYPDEGAGFLFGTDGVARQVVAVYDLPNAREDEARHNRYLVTPQAYLKGELEAERLGLDVIGVFHSHPDSPERPSEYDRAWALPFFSYVITRVQGGQAIESRSWRLTDDRAQFIEEILIVKPSLS